MRVRLLCALTAVAALFAVPSGANALTIGISENQPAMFTDPLFQQLNAKHVRIVMAYNVVAQGGHDLQRVDQYMAAAKAAGIEPLVTFEHARGAADRCNKRRNFNRPVCKLPTVAEYEQSVREFISRYPDAKVIAPWNEMQHFTQGTSRSPARAAAFTDTVRKNCADCTVLAADILDQADSAKAKRPKFNSTKRWIKRYRRALKMPRDICGVHNYSDTNRYRQTGTRTIIRALGCKEIWLTETGGLFSFGSFRASESRQLRATKYMFKTATSNRKITRLYVYTWFGKVTRRFDAGLVADGKPRSSYSEIKKRITASQKG